MIEQIAQSRTAIVIPSEKRTGFTIVPESPPLPVQEEPVSLPAPEVRVGGTRFFWASKRVFDILFSLVLLFPLLLTIPVLMMLNPFLNRGSVFFFQIRMGKDCRAFWLIKFRTMTKADQSDRRGVRGHNCPVEEDRITPLGAFLRATRIDELPQVLNVLKGDMSLIGPRPDHFAHARAYNRIVRGYKERHFVRPGISGLAQVENGYAEGISATSRKANLDLRYIREAGFALEARIFLKTLGTVFLGHGK